MITLTRLDGSHLTVNAELIEFVEPTPDTVVSLTSGKKVVVRESVADVISRVVEYRQRIYAGLPLCRSE